MIVDAHRVPKPSRCTRCGDELPKLELAFNVRDELSIAGLLCLRCVRRETLEIDSPVPYSLPEAKP